MKKLTNLRAVEIIEMDNTATAEEWVIAYAHLIKNGLVWHFQGFYGRTASRLIESGLINHAGDIDWEIFRSLQISENYMFN